MTASHSFATCESSWEPHRRSSILTEYALTHRHLGPPQVLQFGLLKSKELRKVRSRFYRGRCLQLKLKPQFAAFSDIRFYTFCTLLHRSNLRKSADVRQEKVASVDFLQMLHVSNASFSQPILMTCYRRFTKFTNTSMELWIYYEIVFNEVALHFWQFSNGIVEG